MLHAQIISRAASALPTRMGDRNEISHEAAVPSIRPVDANIRSFNWATAQAPAPHAGSYRETR
jgi:hypothetical protein